MKNEKGCVRNGKNDKCKMKNEEREDGGKMKNEECRMRNEECWDGGSGGRKSEGGERKTEVGIGDRCHEDCFSQRLGGLSEGVCAIHGDIQDQ